MILRNPSAALALTDTFSVKLNQDEFNAIVNNQFYNATVQQTTAATGKNPVPGGSYQVKLPAGCLQGTCPDNGAPITGAIELKAAWRMLTDQSQYSRYLTSQAVLVNNGACSTATVGLVGLHIIHKTVTQPNGFGPPLSMWTTSHPRLRQRSIIPTASARRRSRALVSANRRPQPCTRAV